MIANDEIFMREALKEAARAAADDEVPVGAVVVRGGTIIARGYNRREQGKDATLHAEMIAIREACRALGGWRLPGCTLYVTLEPCPMCAGAIINARIERLVYGAADPKSGAAGSVISLLTWPGLNHHPLCEGNILAREAAELLKDFFARKR